MRKRATGGKGLKGGPIRSRPIEEEQRPWGSFHTLEEGPGYKVKRLVILPGRRLSLQKHRRRAEHWVVVAGTPTVTNGSEVVRLVRRACTVIPRRAWHRIENRGRTLAVVIEVQHGDYLGEDDIIRKQDDYGRAATRSGYAGSGRQAAGGNRIVRSTGRRRAGDATRSRERRK